MSKILNEPCTKPSPICAYLHNRRLTPPTGEATIDWPVEAIPDAAAREKIFGATARDLYFNGKRPIGADRIALAGIF
jgi:hypothetical protein